MYIRQYRFVKDARITLNLTSEMYKRWKNVSTGIVCFFGICFKVRECDYYDFITYNYE